jgi:glycosyltransferase involved in cell wall biosynthesis
VRVQAATLVRLSARDGEVVRVVYLHQYFRTPAMAGGTRSYEFARRLVGRGHQVHVVTSDTRPRRGAPRWRVTEEAGAVVHWAAVPYGNAMGHRRRLGAFGRFARVAAGRAAGLGPDLVVATSTPLTVAVPGVYAARRNGVPMVFEVRDVWPEVPVALGALRFPPARWAAGWLESWAYRNARCLIALSPPMTESILRRFPGLDVTTIPNGCDIDLFAAAPAAGRALRAGTPWLGRRPLVVYAGTLGPANGVGFLVRVAAHLAGLAPELRIAIAGGGAEQEALRALAARLGVLDRNLHLIGEVPKREVVGYLGAAELAVSTFADPALGANSPNKVFDALAAGCPVGTNVPGWIADLIREAGAGLVLPAGDPPAAAAAIAAFVRDPDRVGRARAAARDLAVRRFHRDLLYDEFERVLRRARDLPRVGAAR